MITYHEMEDDVLYSREMDDLLAQISRAAGEKITLRRYCPQYDSPANVPQEKRSALHTALYREKLALMMMADSARFGVTLGQKISLYREALDALEEAHRGDGGRPITFSSFKELLGKAAEEAARQRAGREQS